MTPKKNNPIKRTTPVVQDKTTKYNNKSKITATAGSPSKQKGKTK